MDISILFSLKQPIYEQITEQIIAQILNGELNEGYQLPSIRKLANELTVSVITTKRAYEELERSGYVNTVSGKGTFVALQDKHNLRIKQVETIKNELKRIIPDCKKFNIGLEEIQYLVKSIFEEG